MNIISRQLINIAKQLDASSNQFEPQALRQIDKLNIDDEAKDQVKKLITSKRNKTASIQSIVQPIINKFKELNDFVPKHGLELILSNVTVLVALLFSGGYLGDLVGRGPGEFFRGLACVVAPLIAIGVGEKILTKAFSIIIEKAFGKKTIDGYGPISAIALNIVQGKNPLKKDDQVRKDYEKKWNVYGPELEGLRDSK